MDFLPAIARKLHHCRDLSDSEPFDFLTWFEYAAEDAPAFDKLVASLRSTIEWTYVERKVDIRLIRCDAHMPVGPPRGLWLGWLELGQAGAGFFRPRRVGVFGDDLLIELPRVFGVALLFFELRQLVGLLRGALCRGTGDRREQQGEAQEE